MNIFPKQRNFINRKAIFFFATQNKNETVALNAKDKISRGYINDELPRTDNIANNASNVNNTDTKISRDVDIDQPGAYPRRFRHLLLVLQLVYSICSIVSIIVFS